MKNNCDVSGEFGNSPECKGGEERNGCAHFSSWVHFDRCSYYHLGHCQNLAAIRAAIEAERMETIGKKIAARVMKMMMIEAPFRCADYMFYHTHNYYTYHDCGLDYHLPFDQRRKDNKVDPNFRPQWCIDKDVEVEE